MAITGITRDWGDNVSIVRINSTNTLAECSAANYITAQEANIEALNNGPFSWLVTDMTLVQASDGWMFASISSDFTDLNPLVFSTTVVGAPVVVDNLVSFASTGGNIKDSGIAAADVQTNALATNHIFVGSAGGIATDVAMSGDATIVASGALTIANNAVTTAKINAAAVTLAKLASGIAPSHVVKFAGQPTTVGGSATEAFTVTGAAATDLAFVQIVNNGTNNVTVLQAVVTLNTLTITFSGDPAADTVFNYQLLRAAT